MTGHYEFNHLNGELVQYVDPHCKIKFDNKIFARQMCRFGKMCVRSERASLNDVTQKGEILKFGFRMVRFGMVDHSKTVIQNVPFSNVFRIWMFSI